MGSWSTSSKAEYTDAMRAENSEGICQEGIDPGARKLQEETLGAQDCRVCGSYGRKGTNSETEKTRCAGRELQQTVGVAYIGTALRVEMKVYASRRTAAASPIFCFTLDKVGVLEYSRSVTQKFNL